MPTRSIDLTKHFDRFIEAQVASGRYGTASEIVGEALRLLEENQEEKREKLRALRKAARQGFDAIDQGQGIRIRDEKDLDDFFDEVEAEADQLARSKGRGKMK